MTDILARIQDHTADTRNIVKASPAGPRVVVLA